ncbi:hypothetical protein Celaphus_00016475, partial [Cervus elaphus hippelaphus]
AQPTAACDHECPRGPSPSPCVTARIPGDPAHPSSDCACPRDPAHPSSDCVCPGAQPTPRVTARVPGPAHGRDRVSSPAVSPSKEIRIAPAARRSSMSSGSSGYFSSSPTLSNSPPVLCNPKSVLKRPVTSEELLTPGAPYARKTFTIVGDAVGWGFVVRGSKPCHIQAVDPSGPAAAAGMKRMLSLAYLGSWADAEDVEATGCGFMSSRLIHAHQSLF